MSLDKAIQRGKERREPYRGAKAVDCTCRNHGSCPHCTSNRLHGDRKRLLAAEEQLDEWAVLEQELAAMQTQIDAEEDPLAEADREMDVTDLRYSSGEVLEAMIEAAKP